MRLLPIVGRELRENARRAGTYRLRVRVASQAVLVGIAAYAVTLFNPPIKLGTALFWGVAGVSMLFCLLAGRRSTADCISQEKREGTLGLLFLTDLKGYDVVVGKLVGTSLTSLFALLAVFPVMALPLLLGGTTGGEDERMVVVLVNTFFLSLAIGVFASSLSREYRTAMGANFFLWLVLVGAPAAWGLAVAIARSKAPYPPFFYSCPIYSFIASADTIYRTNPDDFWRSILITHVLAWLLVLLACRVVPRTWGDRPERAAARRWTWRGFFARINYGATPARNAFRKMALDRNAYFWHAARARLKPHHVWLFLALSAAWWIYCWATNGRIWLDEITYLGTTVFLNSALKLWITVEAGHRLGEDRRSGGFELLLPTPMTVSDFVRGQWLALRRQFLGPVAVVMLLEAVFVVVLNRTHPRNAPYVLTSLIVLVPDILALIWVSMAAALKSKTQTQAAIAAAGRILVLPWVLFWITYWVTEALVWLDFLAAEPGERFQVAEWMVITLAVDLICGLQAWWSVRKDFRLLAIQAWQPTGWRTRLRRGVAWAAAVAKRIVPPRLRIPAMATAAVAVVVAIAHFARSNRAEVLGPIVASITQSNAALQVYPGGEGVFIVLPDGTLWRWGMTGIGIGQIPRAAVPEQIGTNSNWLKAIANGRNCAGLRADGTVWEWGQYGGTNYPLPYMALATSNWTDVCAGPRFGASLAVKRDGTIWAWGFYQPTARSPEMDGLVQIGTASNWTAITCQNLAYLGLRSDGTLWTWGVVIVYRSGYSPYQTNIAEPVLLCSDTNWVSLDGFGRARNSVGETWEAANVQPHSDAPAASVCRPANPERAVYRIESVVAHWMSCHIRSDGTLWAAPLPGRQSPAPASTAEHQLGNRSDWVALWEHGGTAFGETADGVLWTWGVDMGQEPVANAQSRVAMLQAVFSGQPAARYQGWRPGRVQPIISEPRPLLKMVKTPAK